MPQTIGKLFNSEKDARELKLLLHQHLEKETL